MSYYMNMSSFNEGEQAESYKKRKANEEESKYDEEYERLMRRNSYNRKQRMYDKPGDAGKRLERDSKVEDMVDRKGLGFNVAGNFQYQVDRTNAKDAANRHMRRHPEQYKECGIFSEVTFLDEGVAGFEKNKIKTSKEYIEFEQAYKQAKKSKDPEVKKQASKKAIALLDKIIEEVKNIPDDDTIDAVCNTLKTPLFWIVFLLTGVIGGAIIAFIDNNDRTRTRAKLLKLLYKARNELEQNIR